MSSRKKVKVLGACDHQVVIREKTEDGTEQTAVLRKSRTGVPMDPSGGCYGIERCADGTYDLIEHIPRKGPSKAATPRYRAGYDAIFGGKRNVGAC